MTSYQEQKMQILKRLIADIDDAMEHLGTPFNPYPSAKVQKRLDDASAAIDELVRTMVIGSDEYTEHKGIIGMTNYEANRNSLRHSQRQVLEEGKK